MLGLKRGKLFKIEDMDQKGQRIWTKISCIVLPEHVFGRFKAPLLKYSCLNQKAVEKYRSKRFWG